MDFTASTVTVTSYNGNAINITGGKYRAKIPARTPLQANADGIFAPRADEFPVASGVDLKERTLPLVIEIIPTGSGTTDELKTWFDTSSSDWYKLLLTDSSDSKSWYVYARTRAFTKEGAYVHRVTLEIADPIWRNNTFTDENWTVTSSGGTHTWTVGGNKYAKPVITITPQTARTGGYGYKRWIAVYNKGDHNIPALPINILGGDFDHAALVTATKAQADGDDFRLFVDGAEVLNKWAGGGGYNSTTLRLWTNIALSPRIRLTLGTAIAGTGAISVIDFEATTANQQALIELGKVENKVLYIGSEAFTFTDINYNLKRVTGVTRAEKYTSEAAHSVGDAINWIQHDIWLCYGDSTATAPTADDSTKPILNLTTSTNSSWVYADYYVKNSTRTGMWIPRVVSSTWSKGSPNPSGNYGADHATNTDLASTASEMGMSIKSAYILYWRPESAEIEWKWDYPIGGTAVTTSGEKYRASTSWPATAALQKSTTGTTWTNVWNEATPGTAATWGAFTQSAISLSGTYYKLRYVFAGNIAAADSNLAHFEVDSITIALDTNTTPSITVGSETSDYYVNAVLQNDTTGDSIAIKYPAATGQALTINTDTKSVTLDDGSNLRGAIALSSVRKEWMKIGPGATTVSYTESGTIDVDIEFSYEERSL